LSSTETSSVRLEVFNGSVLEAVQELCSGLFGYDLLKPDLMIVNVITTDPLKEGEIVSFSVEILNKAKVSPEHLGVARDVYVRLYVDDNYISISSKISLICANHTAYTSVQWRVKSGSHTLKFVVYTADDVNSSNNEYIMNVNIEGGKPVLVISPEVVAIAAGTGVAAGLILFALAGTELGKYKLFTFLAPLYLKTRKEEVLDNFIRGQIYGYVKANPGVHYNLIKNELNLKNGSVTYHLNMLEKQGYVKSQFDGIYRRFYPKDMKIPSMDVTALSKMQLSIINKILERPDITQKDIAKGIDESKQVVSYHLKVLSKAGIVRLKRDGRKTRCYVTNEFQQYVRVNNGPMVG
ncbi:MAG: winged helix-turn-helix transcriptional regulator, partial [Thermoplasmatales archaeon]|nr:winged helix-turn-helix transcriptional regulator [Thermoplasmatales archaeon]